MSKLWLALVLATLGLAPAQAQDLSPPTPPVSVNGAYNASPKTCTDGHGCWLQTDVNGNLKTVSSGTPSGTQDVNVVGVGGNAVTTTVPVSGTVTAAQATAASLNATVVGTGTFATQSAITAASGAIASGAVASGAFASGSQAIGITPTDKTITSASGSSQTMTNALSTRKALVIQNTGNANCGVNPTGGTAAIGGAGTLTLVPQGSYAPRIPTLSAVTIICTAGQPIYGSEY